ncbi:MAG: hypothetical protein FIA82_04205 [Melioribacter sp.]|nr:hypothetical protein [Melioribacter sp.]
MLIHFLKKNIIVLICCILSYALLSKISAQTIERYSKININNISTFIYNTGKADLSLTGDSSFNYPIGSSGTCVYESGLLWTAKVNGQLRSGGFCFNTGLMPGKILTNGTAENPASVSVRPFRVRLDYKTADLTTEVKDEGKERQTIFTQYEKDWNEWPASSGAPFKDVNGNGIYESSIDIPGVPNADQTIWFVTNDLDSIQTKKLFGATTMGIEMQTTVWAYKNVDPLNNMIFKRYIVINKSKTRFEDMYFGIWSDPDLGGDAGDDLVGCDTLLNLDFCYNGDDSDPSYGTYIPSVGFCLLQGPVIQGNYYDSAKFMGRKIFGKKNLQMTALGYFGKGSSLYHDPPPGTYNGTLQLYNLIRGLLNEGAPVPDPIKGGTTKFPYSGDPITRQGFLGGVNYPNVWNDIRSDHRMMLCSGPFNMAPGDTQEVIFAEIAAGGNQGYSRLASVSLLKKAAKYSHLFYKNNFEPPATKKTISDLKAAELDREIILNWGNNVNNINEIENAKSSIYSFQGYNVYQISKFETTLGNKKLIATFDIKDGRTIISDEDVDPGSGYVNNIIKQSGTDSGLQRFISIKKNYLDNEPLYNGTQYDFGVSYYRVTNDTDSPYSFDESPVTTVTVTPQSPKPGVKFQNKFNDIITAQHVSGNSLAEVNAVIIDPTKSTGNDYEVRFESVNGKLSFEITSLTTNKTILSNQTNFGGDENYLVSDGFILKVKNDSNKPLTENDVYKFTMPGVNISSTLGENDINKINVFPNPYYGDGGNEFNKYDKHITFSHLPQRAVIRIFNLAGQLVRKLEKDSPDQFYRWNMLTEENYQVASGLYIAHIELPDFSKVKILKLVIISEEFIPDHF